MNAIDPLKPDLSFITQLLSAERAFGLLRALLVMAVGLGLAKVARRALGRVLEHRMATEQRALTVRVAGYFVIALGATSALREMGFEISVLLGAAGALTVGLSIASQTSASNLISGLFLVAEQPFSVGDTVEVAGLTGEVLSIDILSTKLKMADNRFVRVPNEMVLKSAVINLTRFDNRQVTFACQVALDVDLQRARQVLLGVASAEPLMHDSPAPAVQLLHVDAHAAHFQVVVWTKRQQVLNCRTAFLAALPRALGAAGLRLPTPTPVSALPPAPSA